MPPCRSGNAMSNDVDNHGGLRELGGCSCLVGYSPYGELQIYSMA